MSPPWFCLAAVTHGCSGTLGSQRWYRGGGGTWDWGTPGWHPRVLGDTGGGGRSGTRGSWGTPGWHPAPRDAVTCERPRDVILLPLPGLVVLVGRALVVAGQAALAGGGHPRTLPCRLPLLVGGVVELGSPPRSHPPAFALSRAPWGQAALGDVRGPGRVGGTLAVGPPWGWVLLGGGCVCAQGVTHPWPRRAPRSHPRALGPAPPRRAPSTRSRPGPAGGCPGWDGTPTAPPPPPPPGSPVPGCPPQDPAGSPRSLIRVSPAPSPLPPTPVPLSPDPFPLSR